MSGPRPSYGRAPDPEPRHYPSVMTIRAAGLLISYWGRVPAVKVKNMVERCGVSGQIRRSRDGRHTGSRAGEVAYRAMRDLRREGLVDRDGEDYVAKDLGELAAWLADALELKDEIQHEREVADACA